MGTKSKEVEPQEKLAASTTELFYNELSAKLDAIQDLLASCQGCIDEDDYCQAGARLEAIKQHCHFSEIEHRVMDFLSTYSKEKSNNES